MTKNYYKNLYQYYFNNYDFNNIASNIKKLNKDSILKDCLEYLKDIIKNIKSYEILFNINYHSILWEYLNCNHKGYTNGIFQEFKSILFKNITSWSYNKLNDLQHFNSLMGYILIEILDINERK